MITDVNYNTELIESFSAYRATVRVILSLFGSKNQQLEIISDFTH